MKLVIGLFKLIRPHNIAAAVLSTAVGFSMAGGGGIPWLLLAAVAIAVSAGNTINDFFDRDIDRINKPRRPIPSGVFSPGTVRALYGIQLVVLVCLFPWIPHAIKLWLAGWVVFLFLYSGSMKRKYLAGNLLVSAVASSGFLLGAFAGGRIGAGALPFAYSFIFILGRELVKDVEDLEGDRSCGARTLPVVSGPRIALRFSAALFVLLAVAFPVPFLLDVYGRWYGLIMLAVVEPILFVSFGLVVRGRSIQAVSILLKTGMFFGIMAFYFGATG